MSSPATPGRSIAFSNDSTPSSAQDGGSPQELTPRSKVKAMLAAIDDESDSEPAAEPKKAPRKALTAITGNAQPARAEGNVDEEEHDSAEGDISDDFPVKPRGRLASRLVGSLSDNLHSTSCHEDESDENAYARVKRQLQRKKVKKVQKPFADSDSDCEGRRKSTERGITLSVTPVAQTTPNHDSHGFLLRVSSSRNKEHSPRPFVSADSPSRLRPAPMGRAMNEDSDSDLPAEPQANSRFLELVAKKRAEREAKQAQEEVKRGEKWARHRAFERQLAQDASSGSGMSDKEVAIDRKLTQQARPSRKASKRALEEMNRETQRMSRNMQLAHQAKTTKKLTKDSLFARFNFRMSATAKEESAQNISSSTAPSSAPVTDIEDTTRIESPPTSPISPDDVAKPILGLDHLDEEQVSVEARSHTFDNDELPSMDEVMSLPAVKPNKGKGKAKEQDEVRTASVSKGKKYNFTQRPIKIYPPTDPSQVPKEDIDLDSDLEVLPTTGTKTRSSDVFDRLPPGKVQQDRSLQTLRALAHLNSPERKGSSKRASTSLADMQISLQRRARQQAVEERTTKIKDLKARGVMIQTAEERQQEQAEVEDLLEKARKEGEEIQQKEKRAARKAKIADGQIDGLPDTSDEDEDYEEDEACLELSGSEEEQAEDLDEIEQEASGDYEHSANDNEDYEDLGMEDEPHKYEFVDNAASEDGDDEEDAEQDSDEQFQRHQSRRNKMVIDDEDDDDLEEEVAIISSMKDATSEAPTLPAIFAASKDIALPMGMTQAFAATMADTQTQAELEDEEQASLALLGTAPDPKFPMFETEESLQMIEDSQTALQLPESNRDINLHFSQSQLANSPDQSTQDPVTWFTQGSEIPDPTQDVGFGMSSPAPERLPSPPPSTVDTLPLSRSVEQPSPTKRKHGRFQRHAVVDDDLSDVDQDSETIDMNSTETKVPNAFAAMEKARKKVAAAAAKAAFDRKKSEAKGMVEEQAQESEDEFQGIGGPSDDESGGEDDEFVREMIDQGEVDVNERQLAALHADRERASDEKAVEKLYKDINSGMLRRKRGAEFDLSDSDDDAENRQRRKRREFAKMRKALLENENVGKIAEDPKKVAFLRAIEDREYDEDLDFLQRPADESFRMDTGTQEEAQSQEAAPSDSAFSGRKRPLEESIPPKSNMRPPAPARRTAPIKKPATLAEIRESVSFLIEEPGSIIKNPDPSSSASEDESLHHSEHRNPRRTTPKKIVDRLSLKRAESASTSSNTRFAFQAPSPLDNGGFKVPSLLRRATTSSLSSNGADANGISTAATVAAATERAAGGEKGDYVRRGGRKGSSVNFAGREKERRVVVELVEKRRVEEREKEARRRRMGLSGVGVAFE